MLPSKYLPALASLVSSVVAIPVEESPMGPSKIGKRCTGTISKLSDVSAAVACTTININAFTVDAGSMFSFEVIFIFCN
jgi:polygalacturonase